MTEYSPPSRFQPAYVPVDAAFVDLSRKTVVKGKTPVDAFCARPLTPPTVPTAPVASYQRQTKRPAAYPPVAANRGRSLSITGLYAAAFNLRERPFTLLPDPDFLYWTKAHQRAFTVLEYGILSRAPITVVTGDVGVGKTTLLHQLLKSMEKDATIGLISNAQGGRGELIRWALNAFDVAHDRTLDYVGLFQELQNFLLGEYAAGRHVVMVIDEAQNLSFEALEELRMLTNINSNKDELLQLVLIGQPELREMVERPELRQFAQRVTASFHLTGMDAEGTANYIAHRMRHVGGTGREFSPEAAAMIHRAARGIPRMINKICDLCLIYAAAESRSSIEKETVSEVMADNLFIQTRGIGDTPEKS